MNNGKSYEAADVAIMMAEQKKNILTKSQLYQKFKQMKDALRLGDIHIQTERKRAILERIEHYTKTGNARKLDIYQRKLEDVKI